MRSLVPNSNPSKEDSKLEPIIDFLWTSAEGCSFWFLGFTGVLSLTLCVTLAVMFSHISQHPYLKVEVSFPLIWAGFCEEGSQLTPTRWVSFPDTACGDRMVRKITKWYWQSDCPPVLPAHCKGQFWKATSHKPQLRLPAAPHFHLAPFVQRCPGLPFWNWMTPSLFWCLGRSVFIYPTHICYIFSQRESFSCVSR